MKIAAATMGTHLGLYVNLVKILKDDLSIEGTGLFAADSQIFKNMKKANRLKDFAGNIVKEWELVSRGIKQAPDMERLAAYEEKLGDPTLWNALLSDRRIFFGKYCKYRQSYPSKFTQKQLLGILDVSMCAIDAFFKKFKPDLVLSFGTSTIGEYLFYRFSSYYKVPFLQIKSVKISNYVSLNDDIFNVSKHIKDLYENDSEIPANVQDEVNKFFETVRSKGIIYEGAIISARSKMISKILQSPKKILMSMAYGIKRNMDSTLRNDNHLPGVFIPALYQNLIQPVKALCIEHRIKGEKKYVPVNKISKIGDYIFFPLHFEPEVSLQVFGKPYQNQIELIRNLALSVPVHMKVLVKEHPRSIGFRKFSYYKKLLDIPNVYLVDPFVSANNIVKYARLVAVISGTIGLESIVCKKPVITFGKVPYNVLPDAMIRHICDLNRLGEAIKELLSSYEYEDKIVRRYIASTIMGATPIDLYTTLLAKPHRHNSDQLSKEERGGEKENYERLSKYLIGRINEINAKKNESEANHHS